MTPVTARLRWLMPLACIASGLYLLRLSYRAYALWQENLAIGDMSNVEAYEIEFWPEAAIGVILLLLAGFLVGRWSR